MSNLPMSKGRLALSGLRWEEVLPPPLEDAYARAIVPTFAAHPTEAHKVTLDDNVLYRFGVLEIRVDLQRELVRN